MLIYQNCLFFPKKLVSCLFFSRFVAYFFTQKLVSCLIFLKGWLVSKKLTRELSVFGYFPPSGRTHQSGSNPNQIQIQSEQKDISGSKSNETNNFDNENDNAGDDNCCQSFSLNLANEIKTKHSTREGSYILGSSIINGFKTWISSDGKTAIWYIKENLWCIGDVDNMSTSLCRLVRVSCQDLQVSASRQSLLDLGYLGRKADIWVTSIKWWLQWFILPAQRQE